MAAGKDGIGFNVAELQNDLQQVVKDLEQIKSGMGTRFIAQMQRKALKVVVDEMKKEVKDADGGFTVYRNGGIYAEIPKGTLRRSIGIGKSKSGNKRLFSGFWVGPRVKGSWSNPEKGGWFAHFVNYGYLNDGTYKGPNKGFADRAKKKAMPQVLAMFITLLKQHAKRVIPDRQ
jgi:hypothetical protein